MSGGDDFLFEWLAALGIFVAVGLAAIAVVVVAGPPYLVFLAARRVICGPKHVRELRSVDRARTDALREIVAIRQRALTDMRAVSHRRARELGR